MFIFTHIEKCAGTSFNEILELTFPRYIHVTKNLYGGNEKKNDLSYEQYNKLMKFFPSGIGGHSLRPYNDFLNKKNLKLTFLRNPVDRYMSQFNHLADTQWACSLETFLAKKNYYNFITEKIAGENNYNYANSILSTYDFIGNTDEYNKSLNLLKEVLDTKLIGNLTHKNVRVSNNNYLKFSDLSNHEKLRVEENNKNDIKLYEKYVENNLILKEYSDELNLIQASNFREKCIKKLSNYKKKHIVDPIRLNK